MKNNNSNMARQPRIVVSQAATLRNTTGEVIDCTILDVSHDGFRLRVQKMLPGGPDYLLDFDGQTHRVDIRWATPNEVGGLFLD